VIVWFKLGVSHGILSNLSPRMLVVESMAAAETV
jgi:hypothetical protein